MKNFLSLIIFVAIGYYIYEYHTPYGNQVIDPYYLEIRIKIPNSSIEMVGFGEMNSLTDCETRGQKNWEQKFKGIGKVSAKKQCKKDVPRKYLRMFENKVMNATYIAFDKGNKYERNGRFLFYGLPSSQVQEACSMLIGKIRTDKQYKGKIFCIQGNVG